MKKLYISLMVFLVTSLLFLGCNNTGETAENDTIPSKPITVKKGLVVNVFLDNTSSMEGYAKANDASKFNEVLNGLYSYFNGTHAAINGYYTQSNKTIVKGRPISQTIIKPVNFETLRSEINHKNIKFTDSYQLPDFFNDVVDKTVNDNSHDVISFFITDGILSGTNEEIRDDPMFNINSASTVQSRISDALRKLDDNYASAVFRFKAYYNGKYYKYNNDYRTELRNVSRPFYVIAIGPQDTLNEFYKQVEKGQYYFRPTEKVLFSRGLKDMKVNTPDAVYEKDTIFVDMEDSRENHQFYIEKSVLPSYVDNNSLEILWNGQPVDVEFQNGKYKFDLRLDNYDPGKTLTIRLKSDLPTWVKVCHSSNDNNITDKNTAELDKTFNLEYLVKGIKDGILHLKGSKYDMEWNYTICTEKNQY